MMDLFNKKKLKEFCELYNKTEKMNNDLLRSNSRLIKISEDLQKENQKLIDWIDKMINEVGVKTNNPHENITINIPYCEETVDLYPCKAENNGCFVHRRRKDIIIPSIRFTKFEYKED